MGNQQERSLAWLAGILDGEGSISVQVYNLPDGRVRLTPFACIVNSDPFILAEARRIFAEIGVAYRNCGAAISKQENGSFEGKKLCSTIRCDGQEPVEKLCRVLLPYLISAKRHHAEVVCEYIAERRAMGVQRNEKGHCRRVEYTRRQIELISSIRSHKRAKSSEAICQAPNVVG